LKRPAFVLNILYNNNGIYLSKRLQTNKEMYDMWKVPGGKVDKGESSTQATIRETLEETGISLKKEDLTYLLNDPKYNCDVYITKLLPDQVPQRTEPEKHGAWKLFSIDDYKNLA